MDNNTLSPQPEVEAVVHPMSFLQAMAELIKGKKIARQSWSPHVTYGLLKDGFIMIFLGGEFHKWTINDGDIEGTDWVVYELTSN